MTRTTSGQPLHHLKHQARPEVELVRWMPGSTDYELARGVLIKRTRTTLHLATADGPRAFDRTVWLVCEDAA